jgi:hypothetical protein
MTTIAERKAAAKLALESLIAQCQCEIYNLHERFDDRDPRSLVATGDIQNSVELVMDAAADLEQAFDEVVEAENQVERVIEYLYDTFDASTANSAANLIYRAVTA